MLRNRSIVKMGLNIKYAVYSYLGTMDLGLKMLCYCAIVNPVPIYVT